MAFRSMGSRGQTSRFAGEQRIVTSGVTVNDGDFVNLVSGQVTPATATTRIHGVVRGGEVTNLVSRTYRAPTTVGDGVKQVLIEFPDEMRYQLPVSAALAADAEGKYYLLTGATGAQQIDNTTKSATVGQFICLQRIADSTGAFTQGVFAVGSPQARTLPT